MLNGALIYAKCPRVGRQARCTKPGEPGDPCRAPPLPPASTETLRPGIQNPNTDPPLSHKMSRSSLSFLVYGYGYMYVSLHIYIYICIHSYICVCVWAWHVMWYMHAPNLNGYIKCQHGHQSAQVDSVQWSKINYEFI